MADHSFYSVFDEAVPGRRRLLLSTSHPYQECVDVVLYRRDPAFPEGEERLGHVLLCDIAPGDPADSEIELLIELDDDGRINAAARDRKSGNSSTVAIDEGDAVPEYHERDDYTAGGVEELLEDSGVVVAPRKKRQGAWVLLLLLLVVLAGVLLWAFVLPRGEDTVETTPVVEGPSAEGVTEKPTAGDSESLGAAAEAMPEEGGAVGAISESSIGATGAEREGAGSDEVGAGEAADTEPEASAADPGPGPETMSPTEDYHIKWGDTLWDISRMFYGTPWRFPDIADENRIPDPDKIYADDHIKIPQR